MTERAGARVVRWRLVALVATLAALGALGGAGCGPGIPADGQDAYVYSPDGGRDSVTSPDAPGSRDAPVTPPDGGAPDGACQPITSCDHVFSYPAAGGATSVVVRGDFAADGWQNGVPMVLSGDHWTATISLTNGATIHYKFFVNNSQWVTDPANPDQVPDGYGGYNSVLVVDCGGCSSGVYDWRDAVIYFVFVDRFVDGDSTNNCHVSGTQSTPYTSTDYQGGDWAGVTQKIDDGYFTDLGVNTLWITVPLKNADAAVNQGTNGDSHMYSAYHGYWPTDPTQREPCFGTDDELKQLVQAAHAKGLRVLFDYAMVHVHTSSPLYQQHKDDSPAWFTPSCICGASGCGNYDTSCWFADYLAHFDYTNAAARSYSIDAAVSLVQQTGNDAFRLDAIKQVDPSWLAALRPAIATQVLASENPPQRFYMVGETYDFQNRALIKSMIDPATKLDGQFDFPLRIRLVEAVLMRSTTNLLTIDDTSWSRNARPGMAGLADFMDANDDYYGPDAVMSTFIGNHDLPRSIHYAEDTPFWSDSATDGKGNAWSNQPLTSTNPRAYERLANAFAVLLTNRGAPLIYYGDEIGLPGAGDPDNRRLMQWSGYSTAQQGLYARVKALTAIRAAHPALRRGARQTLSVDQDLWVYKLAAGTDAVIVAINRSDGDRQVTNVPAGLPELLTGGTAAAQTTIPARQTRVFDASGQ